MRSLAACLALVTAAVAAAPVTTAAEDVQIDAGFPGGNIIFERSEGDDVFLRQDPRDTEGFWFYWYFRTRGAAGRTLTFHFTDGNVLGVRGPVVSDDGGRTWRWLGAESMEGPAFKYRFPDAADDVRFALAIPYQEADLRAFLGRHSGNANLAVERHATSRNGREVERLRLGKLDGQPEYRVLLTCRHHSCEMMANWQLEGFMEELLADTESGRWFREHVEVAVLPFMDKDGVEDGDQGKNCRPHDHNRDYAGESIYPEVAALRAWAPGWSAGKLRMFLDLHCPYIRGGGDDTSSNERIFLVGGPDEALWRNALEFSAILERQSAAGPLRHFPKNNLPHGQKWNTLDMARCAGRWAAELPGVSVATTLEFPYANVAGAEVTPDSARIFGHALARAMREYLEK